MTWHISLDTCIAFGGMLLVAWQIRQNTKQAELQSIAQIHDSSQKLLTVGFFKPELFDVLADKPADPDTEQRVLQLWFNQYLTAFAQYRNGVLKREFKDAFLCELSEFLAKGNTRRHWKRLGRFYPEPFQELVNGLLEKSTTAGAAAEIDGGSRD